MKNTLILTVAFFLLATATFAQTEVDTRQRNQRMRIAQGKQNGSVSRKEAHLLRKQQRNIRKTETRAMADGVITPVEEKRLDSKQDRSNRAIRRAKHNGVDRKE